MSNLWFRENRKGIALYVYLFDDVPAEYAEQWMRQLKNENWNHRFLDFSRAAQKNELTSKQFNDVGNEYFQREEWRKAMEFYNQGIRFATKISENMCILYAKRGLSFFRLKMYDKALQDFTYALGMEYPYGFGVTLLEYRDNCIKFLSQATPNPPRFPALNFDADDKHPCMANALELIKAAELNKSHFVAKTDINVGQIILVEEAFTSIAVGFDRTYCFTCLATVQNFIHCPDCVDAMFCSVDCMNRNIVHKMSCSHFYHRMPSYIKLVVQSILDAIASFSTVEDLMKFCKATQSCQPIDLEVTEKMANYATFFSLPLSTKELPLLLTYDAYTTLMTIPFVQYVFNTHSKQRFLMHLVGHHVQVLAINSEGGFEKNQNQFIVATMTNLLAMFEHSCTPNLLRYPIDNKTVLITIQPVRAGDHLTIDYWPEDDDDGDQDVAERRKMLVDNFGIYCKCEKCNPQQSIGDAQLSDDPLFSFVKKYQETYNNVTSPLLKKRCIDFLKKHKDSVWSKEKDIVIKAYTKCFLNDFESK